MNQIEQLYERYGAMVLRRCRFLLRNEADAYDALQDVFAAVLKKQQSLFFTTPSSLLYRMATNECLNRMRNRRNQSQWVAAGDEDDLICQIASDENIEDSTLREKWLSVLFGRETESTKVIAVMHYVDGMTLEQVASEVGLSVSGVRKRLRKLAERAKELDGKSV